MAGQHVIYHNVIASGHLQAARADAVLSRFQVQQQRGEDGGTAEELQTLLMEEQRRSQQLEETLRLHVQQSSSQINMKQVNYFFYSLYLINFLVKSLLLMLMHLQMSAQKTTSEFC